MIVKFRKRTQRSADKRPSRRGATVVEFAVVAPVFFLLLFAGIEFATLSTIRATSHNAAYEGARKIVIPGADVALGIAEAERIMGIIGVDELTVTVTVTVTVTPNVITNNTRGHLDSVRRQRRLRPDVHRRADDQLQHHFGNRTLRWNRGGPVNIASRPVCLCSDNCHWLCTK
jgi:hypothetical protein